MIVKNQASQGIYLYAHDTANDVPKTGDAANITAYISKDGGAAATSTNSVSEISATNMPGVYWLSLTQTETNANQLAIKGKSSTSDVQVDPILISTVIPADYKADVSGLATAAGLSAIQGDVSAILLDTGTDGVVLSTAQMQAIADEVLKRGVSNVDTAADEFSLGALIIGTFKSDMSDGINWTLYRVSDGLQFAVRTPVFSGGAQPVVSVS